MLFQAGLQKTWASSIGVVLIMLGVLGPFGSEKFGIFSTNLLHDLIRIITGIVFICVGIYHSQKINRIMGFFHLIFALAGFLSLLYFLGIANWQDPDNYFHLSIGIVSLFIGYFIEEDLQNQVEHKHADMVYEE